MTPSVEDAIVLSDAESAHLARIAEDCEGWLGPDAELLRVRCETDGAGIRLVATYRLGARERESAAAGETLLAAHSALRARVLIDRIRFGFADYVER